MNLALERQNHAGSLTLKLVCTLYVLVICFMVFKAVSGSGVLLVVEKPQFWIEVGFFSVTLYGRLFALEVPNLCLNLATLQMLGAKVLIKWIIAPHWRILRTNFFLDLTEEGSLDLFDLNISDHLLCLESKQVLFLLKEIESRFWRGDVVYTSKF